MPGTQDQDTVKPLSYIPIGEDGGITPEIPPTPAPISVESAISGII